MELNHDKIHYERNALPIMLQSFRFKNKNLFLLRLAFSPYGPFPSCAVGVRMATFSPSALPPLTILHPYGETFGPYGTCGEKAGQAISLLPPAVRMVRAPASCRTDRTPTDYGAGEYGWSGNLLTVRMQVP